MIVAIDGPAGAGKSTVARMVAKTLGWDYLDTGAMYRAVALLTAEEGTSLDDEQGIARIAREANIRATDERVVVNGRDVTDRIREEDVTRIVSRVAAIPSVREVMAAAQRRAAESGNVVMEGRDIGSIVAPDAEVKIYLTATPAARAILRVRQQNLPDTPDVVEAVRASIVARDTLDTSRSESPLTQTPDAVLVDATDLSIDEVVARIVGLVDQRVAG